MQSFFDFKLFICPPDVKKTKFLRGLPRWTPTRAPPWTRCGAYSTSRTTPTFYKIQKLSLCSKTDITKTPWINAWQVNRKQTRGDLKLCLKVRHSPSKKNFFIWFIERPLKMMKNDFYFILEALLVLKILKFLLWLFGHVEKTAWLER